MTISHQNHQKGEVVVYEAADGESRLDVYLEKATTKSFLVVQTEGKRQVRRTVKHYNLDAMNLLAEPLG